jgi:hypothetical protein
MREMPDAYTLFFTHTHAVVARKLRETRKTVLVLSLGVTESLSDKKTLSLL